MADQKKICPIFLGLVVLVSGGNQQRGSFSSAGLLENMKHVLLDGSLMDAQQIRYFLVG